MRVVIATVAFEMGVRVDKLNTVIIHSGPSRYISDYFQESGRIGRGGLQSFAVIMIFRGRLRGCRVDEKLHQHKNYVSAQGPIRLLYYDQSIRHTLEEQGFSEDGSGQGWVHKQLLKLTSTSFLPPSLHKLGREITEEERQHLRNKIISTTETQSFMERHLLCIPVLF